jgi:hypothetical protein
VDSGWAFKNTCAEFCTICRIIAGCASGNNPAKLKTGACWKFRLLFHCQMHIWQKSGKGHKSAVSSPFRFQLDSTSIPAFFHFNPWVFGS